MKPHSIEYKAQVWKEGRDYIAHAMPLDVMSSGKTPEAAREALDEAVELFLETAAEMRTLDSVLRDCGYTRGRGAWISPAWVGVESRSASVGI